MKITEVEIPSCFQCFDCKRWWWDYGGFEMHLQNNELCEYEHERQAMRMKLHPDDLAQYGGTLTVLRQNKVKITENIEESIKTALRKWRGDAD